MYLHHARCQEQGQTQRRIHQQGFLLLRISRKDKCIFWPLADHLFLLQNMQLLHQLFPKKLAKDTTNYFFVFQDTLYLVIFLDYFEVVFEPVLSQFPLFQEGFQPDFFLLRTFLAYQVITTVRTRINQYSVFIRSLWV